MSAKRATRKVGADKAAPAAKRARGAAVDELEGVEKVGDAMFAVEIEYCRS
ncbi:MAG: hypothetical protein Q8P67_03075 [archaeon]|nr:hypothetical protein [archaeon]